MTIQVLKLFYAIRILPEFQEMIVDLGTQIKLEYDKDLDSLIRRGTRAQGALTGDDACMYAVPRFKFMVASRSPSKFDRTFE